MYEKVKELVFKKVFVRLWVIVKLLSQIIVSKQPTLKLEL